MIRTGFHYRVEAVIEFTGHDLAVMALLASRHYDGVCKRTFTVGGFGYGWLIQFLCSTGDDSLSLIDLGVENLTPELAARKFEVVVTGSEVDQLRKVIEMGNLIPMTEENTSVASKLWAGLGKVFAEMNNESRRLHGRE